MTEAEVRELFGYNLKRLRKTREISQIQLAEKVGMHFTFINSIENGKKWVSPETIAKFTEALGTEAYQFFLPKDYKIEQTGDIGAFAKDLYDSFQTIKSRYGIN